MRNSPSENFSQKSVEKNTISPEMQKTLNNAISEIRNNPETAKKVTENFASLFDFLANNPETSDALDAKISEHMHTQLEHISQQFSAGEIYREEAIDQSRAEITRATQNRLYILQHQHNFPVA
jgi:hypothetical protein